MTRIVSCFLAAIMVIGCSEDKQDNPPPTPSPDRLVIAVSPQNVTVQRGSSASISVSVFSTSSQKTVDLAFASSTMSILGSFSEARLQTGGASLFTFTPDFNTTVSANHLVTFTASAPGVENATASITVNVTAAPVQTTNFINLSQQRFPVQRGKSFSIAVSVNSTGTPVSANLSLVTPGPTFSGTFSPSQVSTGGGVSLLTVSVGESTPVGDGYVLSVTMTPVSGPSASAVLVADVTDVPVQAAVSVRLSEQRVTVQRGQPSPPVGVSISTTGTPETGNLSFLTPVSTVTGGFVPAQVSTGGGVSVFQFTPRSDTPVGSTFTLTILLTPPTGLPSIATLTVDIVDVPVLNEFSVFATQTSFTLLPGQSTSPFPVVTQVTLGNPIDLTGSFSSIPAGITGTLSQSVFKSGGSVNAVLTAPATVVRGIDYAVTLTLSGPTGVPSHAVQMTVTVPPLPGPSDHTVNVVDPSTPFALDPAAAATVAVATAIVSGTAHNLSLTLESVPAGCVSGSFNPASVLAGTGSVLSFTVSGTAAPGNCLVTVRATDTVDNVSRSDSFTVAVRCSTGQACSTGQICGANLTCVTPGAVQPFQSCTLDSECLSGVCLTAAPRICAPPPIFLKLPAGNPMQQFNDGGNLLSELKFSTSPDVPVVSSPLSRVAGVTAPGTAPVSCTFQTFCSPGFIPCRVNGVGIPFAGWDFCATVP